MFIVVSALPQQDVLSRSLDSHCRKCVQQHKAQTATLQGTIKFTRYMAEVSFISFPSQLSIHSPNDVVKKRNIERDFCRENTFAALLPLTSAWMVERRQGKCDGLIHLCGRIWSKKCNTILSETTSGSWDSLSKRACHIL